MLIERGLINWELFITPIYNHPYYVEHLDKLRICKRHRLGRECGINVPSKPNEKIARAANIVMKRNDIKLLDAKNKKELLRSAPDLFPAAMYHLPTLVWICSIVGRKQMDNYIDQYIGFVSPEFIPVVLDEDGQMIAFGIVVPSLSKALQRYQMADYFHFNSSIS